MISDLDAGVLESGREALAAHGDRVEAVLLDGTDSAAVARAAAETSERFGAVDILIANAGIAWPDTPGESVSDDAWRKVVDVDLNGAYWSCREFGPAMLGRGRGAIVTVGSHPVSGLRRVERCDRRGCVSGLRLHGLVSEHPGGGWKRASRWGKCRAAPPLVLVAASYRARGSTQHRK